MQIKVKKPSDQIESIRFFEMQKNNKNSSRPIKLWLFLIKFT